MGAVGPAETEGSTVAEGATEGETMGAVGPAEPAGVPVTVIRVVVVDGPAPPAALEALGAKIPPGLLGITMLDAEGAAVAETKTLEGVGAMLEGAAVGC